MAVSDLMDSDQRILAHTTRVQENGTTLLTFDWQDGSQPLKGVLPEKLDASILVEWCTAVRRAHNARENSKAATKDSTAAVVRGPSEGASAAPDVSSGGGLPVETSIKDVKAALESGIESALSELGGRKAVLDRKLAEAKLAAIRVEAELGSVAELVRYYNDLRSKL